MEVIAAAFLAPVLLLTPTARDIAVLVSTHYALELGKSPEGTKVMSLIRKKANEYLDEALAEKKK